MGASCSSCKSNYSNNKIEVKSEKLTVENSFKQTNNLITHFEVKETYFSNFDINKEGNPKVIIENFVNKMEFLMKFCNFKMTNVMIDCYYLISIKILNEYQVNSAGDISDELYLKKKKIDYNERKNGEECLILYSKVFKGEESKFDIEYFDLISKDYDKLMSDFLEIVRF